MKPNTLRSTVIPKSDILSVFITPCANPAAIQAAINAAVLSETRWSKQTTASSAENLKTKKNLQKTNYQLNELQMNQLICNDSLFVAELSFVAVDPSPWGYIVVVDGMFYSFEPFHIVNVLQVLHTNVCITI